MKRRLSGLSALALATTFSLSALGTALACTRTLYVGADNTVITGRNMDWSEDMSSNLWVFPAGLKRDGAAGPKSIQWTSKYGSVVTSGYEVGQHRRVERKGTGRQPAVSSGSRTTESTTAASRSCRSPPGRSSPSTTMPRVAEAVDALRQEPFQMLAPSLPNGSAAALHLAISDSSGNSAIFEYVERQASRSITASNIP